MYQWYKAAPQWYTGRVPTVRGVAAVGHPAWTNAARRCLAAAEPL